LRKKIFRNRKNFENKSEGEDFKNRNPTNFKAKLRLSAKSRPYAIDYIYHFGRYFLAYKMFYKTIFYIN
jgi:hypothetical protein